MGGSYSKTLITQPIHRHGKLWQIFLILSTFLIEYKLTFCWGVTQCYPVLLLDQWDISGISTLSLSHCFLNSVFTVISYLSSPKHLLSRKSKPKIEYRVTAVSVEYECNLTEKNTLKSGMFLFFNSLFEINLLGGNQPQSMKSGGQTLLLWYKRLFRLYGLDEISCYHKNSSNAAEFWRPSIKIYIGAKLLKMPRKVLLDYCEKYWFQLLDSFSVLLCYWLLWTPTIKAIKRLKS